MRARRVRRCRVCKCSEFEPCNPPCAWSEEDLCSGCESIIAEVVEWFEGAHIPNLRALAREVANEFGKRDHPKTPPKPSNAKKRAAI